jgi:hypothetical protein
MNKTFLLIGLLYSIAGTAQIDFTQSHDWTLYKANKTVIFKISPDSLSHLPSVPLNEDTIIYYLQGAKPLPTGTKAEWQGGFLASCKFEGQIRKFLISAYGGFIYDTLSGLFYQLPNEEKDNWWAYIKGCESKL